jgi:hypothetical protein
MLGLGTPHTYFRVRLMYSSNNKCFIRFLVRRTRPNAFTEKSHLTLRPECLNEASFHNFNILKRTRQHRHCHHRHRHSLLFAEYDTTMHTTAMAYSSSSSSSFVSFVKLFLSSSILLLLLQLPCVASISAGEESYDRLTLDQIVDEMKSLEAKYPEFVTYDTSQDRYGLPLTCPLSEDQNTGCSNHLLIISDPKIYSHRSGEGQIALQQRPDVFLSGALHGNERVGRKNTPYEYIISYRIVLFRRMKYRVVLLLSYYRIIVPSYYRSIVLSFHRIIVPSYHGSIVSFHCKAHSQYFSPSYYIISFIAAVALMELAKLLVKAAACQAKLTVDGNDCTVLKQNLGVETVGWLARLVTTRRIVIVPTPNSSGYYANQRTENGIDPNRDFPYDQNESQCMKSITARTINEIFLDHLFQMSMTYHGGIENITFEWGAISVPNDRVSPDDVAQRILADKMSLYAGELNSPISPKGRFYETGDMNDILYGVNGGFEDWAYAGSWEKTLEAIQCTPSSDYYGGYPAEKTQYDDATLRTFNILIETSSNKNPLSSELGTNLNLLTAPFAYDGNTNNGYVTKQIRTALLAIDIAEPYLEINKFQRKKFNPESKPLKRLRKIDADSNRKKWQIRRKLVKTKPRPNRRVEWSVGGSITVDETYLIYGKYSNFPDSFGSVNQLNQTDIDAAVEIATATSDGDQLLYVTKIQSGGTRWTDPTSSEVPKFSTRLDLRPFNKRDKVAVYAIAKVDQNWKNPPPSGTVWPVGEDIQSHIVKQRTDASYTSNKMGKGRIVQGRLDWISAPLTIIIR